VIRAAKVDSNQPEIVKALRKIGASVLITSQLKNAFDILVGYRDQLFIIEIKDGTLPPSKRKLSPGRACRRDVSHRKFSRRSFVYHYKMTTLDVRLN